MARKVCTAGAVGSFSFLVLEDVQNSAVASVRSRAKQEITSRHVDVEHGVNWTERLIQELNGKRYEVE